MANFGSAEMPRNEHLVLCGGLEEPKKGSASRLELNLHGKSPNVHLKITDISKRLLSNIPDVLVDLLEVATYIYAADGAISRGGKIGAQMGARWRRKFRFLIPVRQPDLWSSEPVLSALVETLSFLSDDDYGLEFRSLNKPPTVEHYFEFSGAKTTTFTPDQVILFSGGLDSFAGAVEQLAVAGKKLALVSHRSASKIAGAQKHLVDQLRSRFGDGRVLHVPVWATLNKNLGRESTHRTRSFLFAAFAAVTARLFKRNDVYFFENGVVSLNLPTVAQVIGARATRTTHPQALAGFRRIFAAVLGKPFGVENPFAWLTKSEVIEKIAANGCGNLIRDTRSCTRVHDMTVLHPHCGQCSQCVDRRFAVLAARQEHEDPAEAYMVDLFRDARPAGPDREMALAFVRGASRVAQMTDEAFFAHHGETSRVVACFRESTDVVAGRILDLHRRHALAVCRVLEEAIRLHAGDLRQGGLPPDCLLSLIVGQRDSAYAITDRPAEQPVTVGSEIRMAIDAEQGKVVFERWGELSGVGAELLIALAESFRQATAEERTPYNYPFTKAETLRRLVNCADGETLRRRIHRCRLKVAELARKAGDPPPSLEAVIENQQWHGYRLNPDRIRLVAISELAERK